MQFDQLKYLTELHKTLCMTRAAENLYVTQPAISKSLNNLEKELGIKLFTGTRSGVVFTMAGEKIVRQSRKILNQIRSLEVNISDYQKNDERIEGTLNVAALSLLFQPVMSNIVSDFKSDYPNIVLDIRQMLVKQLTSDLVSNSFDVALMIWDEDIFLNHPQIEMLERQIISDVNLCIAMNAKHPLNSKKIIEIEDLLKFQWISGNFNNIVVFLKNLDLNVTLVTEDIDIAFENLLENDYLYATTNLSQKHPYVRTRQITIKPLNCSLSLKFGCVYFKNPIKRELIDMFINYINMFFNENDYESRIRSV